MTHKHLPKEQFIELDEIDVSLSFHTDDDDDDDNDYNPSMNSSFNASTVGGSSGDASRARHFLVSSPLSQHKSSSEKAPILASARERSSSHASYFTFENASQRSMEENHYQQRATDGSNASAPAPPQHIPFAHLWINLQKTLKLHILEYLNVEELLLVRSVNEAWRRMVRLVPLALNCGFVKHSHAQMQRLLSLPLNIRKIRIKSPDDFRFMDQNREQLRMTLQHIILWMRKDQYKEVKDKISNFFEACMELQTVEFRHMYSNALLQCLTRIPTLRNLHLMVQSEGTIGKLVEHVPRLNISLDVDWCLWSEFCQLHKLSDLTSISFACFEELRALQQKESQGGKLDAMQWMDPMRSVRRVHGKCFSEMHLLFMFHHFPNARDCMEYCGSSEPPTRGETSLDETLNTDEAIQCLWESMTSMAEELKLPQETIERLDETFDKLLMDDLNVWNSFVTIVDLYANSR